MRCDGGSWCGFPSLPLVRGGVIFSSEWTWSVGWPQGLNSWLWVLIKSHMRNQQYEGLTEHSSINAFDCERGREGGKDEYKYYINALHFLFYFQQSSQELVSSLLGHYSKALSVTRCIRVRGLIIIHHETKRVSEAIKTSTTHKFFVCSGLESH